MRVLKLALGLVALSSATVALAQAKPSAEDLKPEMREVETTPDAVASPIPPATPDNTLLLDLSTGGRVAIQLRPDKAPQSVERIKALTRRGFYDGLKFHRVIDGFMAQTGDPKGDGTGGSELPDLKAEFNDMPHVRGVISMARAEAEDSANSQFFIMLSPNLRLDGKYTPVGRVLSGMGYVDAIVRGEPPENPSTVVHAAIAADGPRAAAPAAPAAAEGAAAAAADAASAQAADAKVAADSAAAAAEEGDAATAAERTRAARTQAQGATQALDDAAQALDQAKPAQSPR